MHKFDNELFEICNKYRLPYETKKNSTIYYLDTFRELWEQTADDEPIAFYGAGNGLSKIAQYIDIFSKNVVCIIDNKNTRCVIAKNIPVIPFKKAKDYSFKKIFLTGFNYKEQMKQDIKSLNPIINIIDIYDIVKERRIFEYKNEFFYKKYENIYFQLEESCLTYNNSSTVKEKEASLKCLIADYLQCKDFVGADFYILEYIRQDFADSESMKDLRQELAAFLLRIKNVLAERANKNVFIFILDYFNFEQSKNVPFLTKFAKDSLCFSNVYEPAYDTMGNITSFYTGKKFLEDELYKIYQIEEKDSFFVKDMKARGVKVKHMSSYPLPFLNQMNDYKTTVPDMIPLSLLFWNFIVEVSRETTDCVYFVHSILETHFPHFSANTNERLLTYSEGYNFLTELHNIPHEVLERIRGLESDALNYLNKQYDFYLDLLDTDKDPIIITSDHNSRTLFHEHFDRLVTQNTFKVPLMIKSKFVKPGVYDKIYSTIDICNIIRQLYDEEKEINIPILEYARYEKGPSYGILLDIYKDPSVNTGKIRFNTDYDCYIFNLDGKEEYFLLLNRQNNLIADPAYKKRIDYFRALINIDTREVWRHTFEKYPFLIEYHKGRDKEYLNVDKNPRRLIDR